MASQVASCASTTTSNLQCNTWLSKLGKPRVTIVVKSSSNKSKRTKGSKSYSNLKGNKDFGEKDVGNEIW